ncbi:uncharacterized protein EI97DRAFT_428422 [Westerdykella ornata]|uniref:FAR-17a/AIG1-like protein n=1 Tax=Westerdykella ornata TaxID=318751 RepID=A0A6A6J4N1_WESOR|nr:uncharacterized protein EI97DRAFT_428422 [Westerdykella ornata]KAF2271352.1 hypothetical protein EI97DRAFT_428422 [Westerdykella ornata]
MANKHIFGPNYSNFDTSYRYETSWLFSPTVLFIIRGFLSLYAFTTIFTIFGYNGANGLSENSERSFSYFTNLTYWGLAFYFLFAALHSGSYAFTGTPLLARWPKVLQIAHGMFYSTIVVYPWIVTIVFWALLYSSFDSPFSTWTNTSQHALNAVYALFEIIFPRTDPLPFIDLVPVVVILALYLGLAYVTHATQGFYVYSFLDNTKNSSGVVAGYIVGILVGSVIIFIIVRYLIVFRIWVTEKKLGMTGKFSCRGVSRAVEADAEKGLNRPSAEAEVH